MKAMDSVTLSHNHGPRTGPKPSKIILAALYLVFAAVVARTLTYPDISSLLPRYVQLEATYIGLYTAVFFVPRRAQWLLQLYLTGQCALVLSILSLYPEFDFVIVLFLLLCYQAMLFFDRPRRSLWIGFLVMITGGSLIYFLGLLRGLALSLTTMAAEIIIAAFGTVIEETEAARARSQILLDELKESHRQLELQSSQVEELAAMQERSRVARTLHDTVSQIIFSVSLTARAAEYLLTKDPGRVPAELERLQVMTSEALSQLRSLITQLRPQKGKNPS